jgi:hypothetical protein
MAADVVALCRRSGHGQLQCNAIARPAIGARTMPKVRPNDFVRRLICS